MDVTNDLVLTGIVSGALTTVAIVLFRELTSRAKRAEDKLDRYDDLLSRMADSVELIKDQLLRREA